MVEHRTVRPVALLMLGAALVGAISAFALLLDTIQLARDPGSSLTCDLNVLVGCSADIASPQGSLLGFPNPIVGLVGWTALLTIALLLLLGARLPRWVWIALNLALAGAIAVVLFLAAQSIYVLGVLCPWCMATWAATIAVFLGVTFDNARNGRFGRGRLVVDGGAVLFRWLPSVALGCYLLIAIAAQLRLDLLGTMSLTG